MANDVFSCRQKNHVLFCPLAAKAPWMNVVVLEVRDFLRTRFDLSVLDDVEVPT